MQWTGTDVQYRDGQSSWLPFLPGELLGVNISDMEIEFTEKLS